MTQPKALITRQIPDIARRLLSDRYQVDVMSDGLSTEQWLEAVDHYDAILSVFYDKLSSNILSQAKNLKIISNYAIGLDNIDLNMAKQKNIAVYNLPDIVTDSTADLTLGLLLSLARYIIPAAEFVKSGQWQKEGLFSFCGQELRGKNLGIIGFGRIGQAVAQRAVGFGLNIIFYARKPIKLSDFQKSQGMKQVGFDELIQTSDFVSLHIPGYPENNNIINKSVLDNMKASASLLNLARGTVVDTEALYISLKTGKIKGAALDVTDPEPIKDHPIARLPNCIIVPHIGTTTEECRYEMARQAALNILNHQASF
jgi:glyoxylate reductase